MIVTTLNEILKHGPCGKDKGSGEGFDLLLNFLNKTEADDERLSLLTILESNGLDDALWALRATSGFNREIRLYICWCACSVLSIYEKKCVDDYRPRIAIETSILYAEGICSIEEMDAARADAWVAASDARADSDAASVAASVAARDTASIAAMDAAWVARAASDAAWHAARAKQKKEFIKMCELGKKYERDD